MSVAADNRDRPASAKTSRRQAQQHAGEKTPDGSVPGSPSPRGDDDDGDDGGDDTARRQSGDEPLQPDAEHDVVEDRMQEFAQGVQGDHAEQAEPFLNAALSKSRQATPSLAQVAAASQQNILSYNSSVQPGHNALPLSSHTVFATTRTRSSCQRTCSCERHSNEVLFS